ncbi:purine-nucleoside phosphorylase [Acetobacterium tundrae]|uniref:Uridine phosphorylase n=1 Tax=Acetobacterium tundrae TaxID=132932 RepID=A0ABR6WI25_9FIRM|nr:purine-nucleoside phosphorylase [Acetobacterium tundrae]MBC3795805.1 purine-nucleoside phosphorylase [Acetobacterium tundrae]
MSTTHNEANIGEIAKTVLMPGDPLRAKYIAETFLDHSFQFNTVRNMFGYTGFYQGQKISVMGSGMGMPSIGIYSYELFHCYDVDQIIRIGSAGSYIKDLNVYDLVLAESAWSESTYAKVQNGCEAGVLYSDKELNAVVVEAAESRGYPLNKGRIHSSDVFYCAPEMEVPQTLYAERACICVEMESFALFHNANFTGKKATSLLTISDNLITHEETSPKEREKSFVRMMEIGLDAASACEVEN